MEAQKRVLEVKPQYTMKEITVYLGVHPNTVKNRTKEYSYLFTKGKRKRYYNTDELALILKLFNVK